MTLIVETEDSLSDRWRCLRACIATDETKAATAAANMKLDSTRTVAEYGEKAKLLEPKISSRLKIDNRSILLALIKRKTPANNAIDGRKIFCRSPRTVIRLAVDFLVFIAAPYCPLGDATITCNWIARLLRRLRALPALILSSPHPPSPCGLRRKRHRLFGGLLTFFSFIFLAAEHRLQKLPGIISAAARRASANVLRTSADKSADKASASTPSGAIGKAHCARRLGTVTVSGG